MLNAYVRSKPKEKIYIEIPEEYEFFPDVDPEHMVLLLRKSFYGLKQAGQNWNASLKAFLISLKFFVLTADNCVFVDHQQHVIIAVYVDDTLIFTKQLSTMLAVKQ